jgi:hypothetical protein
VPRETKTGTLTFRIPVFRSFIEQQALPQRGCHSLPLLR